MNKSAIRLKETTMKKSSLLFVFVCLLASSSSFAAVVDLPNGEFFDQSSNVTWKDPHLYTGLSYNYVLASLESGWHIATEAEVASMVVSAGIDYSYLKDVMGFTVNPSNGGGFIAGLYNNFGSDYYHPESNWVGGAYLGEGYSEWTLVSQWWFKDQGLGHSGVWVNNAGSPVPIPAAVWLLGSGLLGLIGIRKKVKK
jgi:hypothetical protein